MTTPAESESLLVTLFQLMGSGLGIAFFGWVGTRITTWLKNRKDSHDRQIEALHKQLVEAQEQAQRAYDTARQDATESHARELQAAAQREQGALLEAQHWREQWAHEVKERARDSRTFLRLCERHGVSASPSSPPPTKMPTKKIETPGSTLPRPSKTRGD